jgi:hypothetical protein
MGSIPPSAKGESSLTPENSNAPFTYIRGAHFWPFSQESLGTDYPCYLTERNQGLVLDRQLQQRQITKQEALIDDLQGRVDWIEVYIIYTYILSILVF